MSWVAVDEWKREAVRTWEEKRLEAFDLGWLLRAVDSEGWWHAEAVTSSGSQSRSLTASNWGPLLGAMKADPRIPRQRKRGGR